MPSRGITFNDVLDMTSWTPHACPVSDIPAAAHTITSLLNTQTSPAIAFLSAPPPSPTAVPPGKPEKLSVYLYRTLTTGLVLSVDDGDERAVGAAVWIGPVAQSTSVWGKVRDFLAWRAVDTYQFYNWVWYGESKLKASRLEAIDQAVKDVWTEALGEDQEKENWYLHMLAVRPEYQGKGIAKTLVKYVTDMADRDGKKCFLITSVGKPNIAIYERMGFELVKSLVVQAEGDDLKIWCMVRQPQSE